MMAKIENEEKHSKVCYILQSGEFVPVKGKPFKNEFGLDLFQYDRKIYEGKTGGIVCSCEGFPSFSKLAQENLQKVRNIISAAWKKNGISPRYTCPEEKLGDVFLHKERDLNQVLAKDVFGNKHYYYRYYNADGVELFVKKNDSSPFRTVYALCEGVMIGIGQLDTIEDAVETMKRVDIKAEIEKCVDRQMRDPEIWVNMGYARVLGCYEEAEAHNASIRAKRELQRAQEEAERAEEERKRAEEERRSYEAAMRQVDDDIRAGKEVINETVNEKSVILQILRQYGVTIPLRTQGWITSALYSIHYCPQSKQWSYRYRKTSRDSSKMIEVLRELSNAMGL